MQQARRRQKKLKSQQKKTLRRSMTETISLQDSHSIQRVLDSVHDGLIIQDHLGSIVFANATAIRDFGLKNSRNIRRMTLKKAFSKYTIINEFYQPHSLEELLQRKAATTKKETEKTLGFQHSKNNNIRWFHLTSTPISDHGNTNTFTALVLKEVTGQRYAEKSFFVQFEVSKALIESLSLTEARANILEIIGTNLAWDIGLWWEVDTQTQELRQRKIWHSPRIPRTTFGEMSRQVSFKRGTGLLGSVWKVTQPEWVPNLQKRDAYLRKKFAKRAGFTSALVFPIVDGNQVVAIVEFLSRMRRESEEQYFNLMKILGKKVGQFIERKHAEELLFKHQQEFRALVEHAPDLILRVDSRCRIKYVNPVIEAITGSIPSTYIGHPLESLKLPMIKDVNVRTACRMVVKTGKETILDLALATPTGHKYYQARIVPEYSKIGKVESVLCIARDVSDQKEEQLRMDYFVSVAGHELKNPLTTLRVYAELLLKKMQLKPPEKHVEYAQRIISAADRLTALINDLLDIAKIRVGKLTFSDEEFDLKKLVQDTVREMQKSITHHITLTTEKSKNLVVFGDKLKVRQAITNLLTNAIRYSPDKREVHVRVEKKRGEFSVEVKDFGIGISKEKKKKIFEPYFQVLQNGEKKGQGLGIGLFLTSEIVKHHHGSLRVKSVVGKGSTFTFVLPMHSKHPKRARR